MTVAATGYTPIDIPVTFTISNSQQQVSAPAGEVNAALGGLFDRRGGNAAFEGSLLIARPDTATAAPAVAMLQTSSTVVTETWYYSLGSQLVAMRTAVDDVDQGVDYLLSDHLGSTSVAHAADGSSTVRQYYYPWGGLRGTSGPVVDTDIGYTGQRLDTSTDLMYYNARYYDPAISRFVSADTIVPNPANPQDLNRYSYVRNNPIGYTDPSGHVREKFVDGGQCPTGKEARCDAIQDRWHEVAENWRADGGTDNFFLAQTLRFTEANVFNEALMSRGEEPIFRLCEYKDCQESSVAIIGLLFDFASIAWGPAAAATFGDEAGFMVGSAAVANGAGGTTRVGRWMGRGEYKKMVRSRRVVEGGGGRTYVVEPPDPAAYRSARPDSVYVEFDVPAEALRTASKPEWAVIPGPNVTTGRYGQPPPTMPYATCIVCVMSN
ncbi:MAG: RHS repeat-associated core domain-containing protein [bacterium]|nr:RHS repeat-associated core domain-containing protein [bacterium]